MAGQIPADASVFLATGMEFWKEIGQVKSNNPSVNWYPFDSLTALPLIAGLLEPCFDEIRKSLATGPVLDIGCADGDLAMLFASFGLEVDAVDSMPTNFNGMEGVKSLSKNTGLQVGIHDLNLDDKFDFPRSRYGLTLFLGTLYHLKNPYYALEKLAFHTEWCIISTRIAQVTPREGAAMEREPLAYLADGWEIDNDATNYWIFSATGLLRILQRTRWAIRGMKRVGCAVNSNPVSPEGDERMFVLAQSRVFCPGLQVRRLSGWYDPEGRSWCWTAKRFEMEVVLPLERELSGFGFRFVVPEGIGGLTLRCLIAGEQVASMAYGGAGERELAGTLPRSALHAPVLRLAFEVESNFAGDGRELGVCVSIVPELLRVF